MNWYKHAREMSASEALFGFMAWLTTREEKSGPFSATDMSSGSAADLVGEFCESNDLDEPKGHWEKSLNFPEDTKK